MNRNLVRLRPAVAIVAASAVLVLAPFATWAFYKPSRLLAPSLAGVECITDVICTDVPSRAREAKELYEDAFRFVEAKVGPLKSGFPVVFCQSEACAQAFGLGRSTAKTFGPLGTVVGPRAWKPYYVRHELIHRLQNERLGALRVLRSPEWFIEGMAYSLSEDPRDRLAEPFERYRSRFEAWLRSVGREKMWEQARKL
jgi:hypothetical protein